MNTLLSAALLLPLLPLSAQNPASLNILDRMKKPPLGYATEAGEVKERRQRKLMADASSEIEQLGFYAVITAPNMEFPLTADGGVWVTQPGEAYPFMGYFILRARLRIGRQYIDVPSEAVELKRVTPDLTRNYSRSLQQLKADNAAEKAGAAQAETNATLREILRQQRRDAADKWWSDYQLQQQLNRLRR